MSPDSSCPSPELLRRSLDPDDTMSDGERQRIEAHVDACQRGCKEAIAALLHGTGLALDPAATPAPPVTQPSPPPALTAPSPTVPGYELLGELGRGGMGVVYKARQLALNRTVALKMLLGGPHAGPGELQRFQVEAEAVAELQHSNIVQIYEIGTQDGLPYFALEYCEGGSLDQKLHAGPLSSRDAARLTETLARAVQHAHEHDILHRDLKPANILLSADGTPKITDFGLARRLQGGRNLTQSGVIMGTPSYMAPEQASGSTRQHTTAVDIYALGALLYELLTGRPPFQAATPLDTMLQVVGEEPVPPRNLQPRVPRDLETICLKCLAKEPARRYGSSAELAEDLRRFQAGEPVRARPVGWVERLGRWLRRHPARAAVAAGAVLALTIGGFLASEAHQARQRLRNGERQRAEERAQLAAMSGDAEGAAAAIDEAEALDASPGRMHLLRGQVAFYQGDSEGAWRHLEQAVRLMPDSVAVKSMLAFASWHTGRRTRFEQVRRELDAMTPRTAEDFLFEGQLESMTHPEESLQTLERAGNLRNSVVGWAARLQARSSHALFTDDAGVAQRALDDAREAKEMLPDNPVVLARSVHAHLVAWGVFDVTRQPERGREALEQAGRDARALEAFPSVPMALAARFNYHHCANDEPTARAVSELGSEFRHALMLYRHGDYEAALAAADRAAARGSPQGRVERGFILAHMPDGEQRAWRAFEELRAAGDLSYFRRYTGTIPLLLGRKPDAVRASLEIRADPTDTVLPLRYKVEVRRFFTSFLDSMCDLISEDELLRDAGRCRPMLCEAHFLIGLGHLAEGDRDGARDHFQKCVDTRVFIYWDYLWARAFLDRLERDRRWPEWITRRK